MGANTAFSETVICVLQHAIDHSRNQVGRCDRGLCKSLRNSLKRFKLWCKENRHRRLPDLFKALNAKLRGYFNYYGVHGNLPSLSLFHYHAIRFLWKYLNQRSQRKSYNWDGFKQLLTQFDVVKPHIVNRPRRERRTFVPGLV